MQRQPPYFNSITSYGKYRFGNPFGNTQTPPLPVLYTIARPAGQGRYEVRGGVYNGRKLLVVRVP